MTVDESSGIPFRSLTLAGTAFIVCGSLAPFRFAAVPFGTLAGRFVQLLRQDAGLGSRSDFVANVLLVVPVAFCAAGALHWKRTAGRDAAMVVGVALAGMLLSLSMEFAQMFLPARVVSIQDVAAQMLGSAAGGVAWLGLGPWLSVRVRRWTEGRERLSAAQRGWLVYVAVFAVWQLMPLDLSLEPAVLVHKYREGRLVTPLCLDRFLTDLCGWRMLVSTVIPYMPLGVCAASCWRPRGASRALTTAFAIAVVAVAAIELSHLLVESRAVALDAAAGGVIGAAAGILAAQWAPLPHVKVS